MSHSLVKRIAATFSESTPTHDEAPPPLWRWAFSRDPVEAAGLGVNSHPARGGFLPPADDHNRMWAGGRLEFHRPPRISGETNRTSTILRVEEKHGHNGALLFVTLYRDYRQDDQLALSEEHDIVYHEPTPPKLGGTEVLPEGDWREALKPDPTLLFHYSAVTFNGHHIHYDWPCTTDTEGYPDLMVHGPLIATLALRAFCRANPRAHLRHFTYRDLRPLIYPEPFEVGGRLLAASETEIWVDNGAGLTQRGDVESD